MKASLKNENLKFDWRILQGFDPVKLSTESVNGQQNFNQNEKNGKECDKENITKLKNISLA